MKHEHLFFVDIETVPMVSSFTELPETLQKLWTKKAQFISPDSSGDALFEERAGIYSEFGKIVCIGLGYFYFEENQWKLKVKTLVNDDEKLLLQDFNAHCAAFFKSPEKVFCGHNIREFDIPYICRRLLINQFELPLFMRELQSKKPWENPMLDTLQYWKFGEYKNFVSLELLAHVLGIPTPKDDIDGSEVARVYWKENNLNRIATYCNKDIITVAQLYLRLQGSALLTEEQIVIL